jgi:hypothetical protein
MRRFIVSAIGLIGLGLLMRPAFADNCRSDLYACIADSLGHPHICDSLVRNMQTCEMNEEVGIQQADADARFTKAGIDELYNKAPRDVSKKH